jgi:arylsulfatase A-like enzyme
MKSLPSAKRLIGRAGASFENAFASYPICCPSRATLLTGQYAHNHGTLGNGPRTGGGYPALIDPERNLAAWLQAAGYETAFVGKWLNGMRTPRRAPPGWDRWHGLVGAGGEGLSSFYDYQVFEPDLSPRHFGASAADYQTDALTREYVLPLIGEQAVAPGPFFLWLAYHPPHDGLGRDDAAGRRCSIGEPDERGGRQSAIPPPRYARRFANAPIPKQPSFDERDLSDKPKLLRRAEPLNPGDLEVIRSNYRCGLAALLAVDDGIRAIVDALRTSRQLANTLLVFTSDHGVMGGEHRIRSSKNRPYEEAIRVPLMIRGPGVVAGAEPSVPVANTDLAPTILEFAGATVPPELARTPDGTSLTPVLAGARGDRDRAILIEGRANVERARRGFKARSYVGVRTRRYAYFEHRRAGAPTLGAGIALPIGAGATTDLELYDLTRDPWQLESVHREPSYAAARGVLARLVDRLERCSGPACAVSEPVPGPGRSSPEPMLPIEG